MDQVKIGKFIKELRQEKNLTQRELAEKLLIADKTVSKWETGKGLPEVSLMMPLCEILGVSVNELLSAEKLGENNYQEKAEENIMNLISERQRAKKNIILAVITAIITIIGGISLCLLAEYVIAENWLRILMFILGLATIFAGCIVCCFLENDAGSFECKHCKTRFVPDMKSYINAIHGITWRRLKCPNCGKVSNCKKRLTK